jgi:DNA-binding MarR family transcriptional regulator
LDGLGANCINRLAQELHLDSSTVTRQVGVLESGGFVVRQVDPDDGRSWLIDLTPQGRKALRSVEQGRRQAIDSMLAEWKEDDLHDLARMIARLNLALFESVTE